MLSKAEPTQFPSDHGVFGTPGDVSPWDIRFDPSDRAHLDADAEGVARIRVWTEPELVDAHLVVRSGDGVLGYPMDPVSVGVRFTFWEVVAGPFDSGAEYSFAFRSPSGKGVYLVQGGLTNAIERLDRWDMDLPESMSVPPWAEGMVVYQIFPDRFSSAQSAMASSFDAWGSVPSRTGFQGGDLDGVAARLDYLSDLGVDAIYLNPIFVSPSNHRFDTIDYCNVDPLLGGNEALARLVEKAHASSLGVILDASFNHVHPRFFAFQDVARRGPESEYWDWFVVEEWPLRLGYRPGRLTAELVAEIEGWASELGISIEEIADEGPAMEPSYEAWYGVATMPRVNLANPEARAYMLGVAAHWITEYGVDGWRMDVARYVDPDFWDDFRAAARAAKPDAYLLCEVIGDASDWLQGNRFDATMNYTFRDLCLRFFGTDEIDGAMFLDESARLWAQYAWKVTLANHNLLGSHDTPRFLTECGGEEWRVRLAAVFQMTFPGAPGIYYGDETGMAGGDDPDSRRAFMWSGTESEHPLHRTYRELAALRKTEPALTIGDWRPLDGRDGMVVHERAHEGRRLIVAINRGDRAGRVDSMEASLVLWGEGSIEDGVLVVPPRSAGIFS